MAKFLSILFTGTITSLYYFPFYFKAFPTQNTKNLLAVVGIIWFIWDFFSQRRLQLNKDYVQIFALAIVFSLIVLFSVTINDTNDMTYARFILSVIIWMSAAYFLCSMVRLTHKHLNVDLLSCYLIWVCVIQCILALIIDNNLEFKNFVNTYIEHGQTFLDSKNVNRLYGIGASLDVAGSRFSAVLVIIAFLLVQKSQDNFMMSILIIAFLIISIVGNIIARTTTVGMLLGMVFIMYSLWQNGYKYRRFLYLMCTFCLFVVPMLGWLYNYNMYFEKLIDFGFEGFISIIQKGVWYTTSNETLFKMIVFPDNIKTWIIGDGYFDNPLATNPYYIGEMNRGFYKGTDIGYLRFIFYCGLIGLITLLVYFFKITHVCLKRFCEYKIMFLLLLTVNLVVWLKVSTDIFLVFAIFLCIPKDINYGVSRTTYLK